MNMKVLDKQLKLENKILCTNAPKLTVRIQYSNLTYFNFWWVVDIILRSSRASTTL